MDIRLLNSSTTPSAAASVAGASSTWSRKKVLTLPPRPLPAWITRSSGKAWSELMPSRRRNRSAKALWTSKTWASGKMRLQRRLGETLLGDVLDRRQGPAARCRSGSTGPTLDSVPFFGRSNSADTVTLVPAALSNVRATADHVAPGRWKALAEPSPTALSPTLPRMYVNVVLLSSTAPPDAGRRPRWSAGRASNTRSMASNSVDLPTPELPVSSVPLRSTCIVWAPWNVPQLTTWTRARRIWPGLVSSPIGSMVAMLTWPPPSRWDRGCRSDDRAAPALRRQQSSSDVLAPTGPMPLPGRHRLLRVGVTSASSLLRSSSSVRHSVELSPSRSMSGSVPDWSVLAAIRASIWAGMSPMFSKGRARGRALEMV